MITKYTVTKQLLFDGDEQELFRTPIHVDEGADIRNIIDFEDIDHNDFEQLKEILGEEDFNAIIKTGAFTPDEGFLKKGYKGSDKLQLYYYSKDKTIYVFAFGEFQPTRCKLYLEGFWITG